MPVRIGPGQMQFTVMFSGPSPTGSERVRPITACFAAVYGLCRRVAPKPSVDAMLTMRGEDDLRRCGNAARIVRVCAVINTSSERCHGASQLSLSIAIGL